MLWKHWMGNLGPRLRNPIALRALAGDAGEVKPLEMPLWMTVRQRIKEEWHL